MYTLSGVETFFFYQAYQGLTLFPALSLRIKCLIQFVQQSPQMQIYWNVFNKYLFSRTVTKHKCNHLNCTEKQ